MTQAEEISERERLIRDLELHQLELQAQNQQLRESQQQLELSAARYADLYDFAPVAYCTLSRTGALLELNMAAAKLLGVDRGLLIGRSLLDFIDRRDHRALLNHLIACRTATEEVSSEVQLRASLRGAFLAQVISAPASEGAEAYRTVLSDVTDRRRAEESLRLSVRMREDFLAIVSHDLRNPLNTIVMRTESLMRALPDDEANAGHRTQLDGIKTASRRMNRLLGDLLDLSSMNAGHLSLQPTRHEVDHIVSSALELIAPLAAEKSLRVLQAPSQTPLTAYCDRERTVQALLNLLSNAVKFTPASGTIIVEASPHRDGIMLAVRDTGRGIPPEQVPLLFRPYWQAQRSLKLGAGLGLSIAKAIIDGQGGEIWVESKRGHGSSFFFTLPASATRAEHVTPDVHSPPRDRKKVLLVENDDTLRLSLSGLLEESGYDVIAAENGSAALARLAHLEPQRAVILFDVEAIGAEGTHFLEHRLADPVFSSVPMILLGDAVTGVAKTSPLTSCLQKPVRTHELLTALEAHAPRQLLS